MQDSAFYISINVTFTRSDGYTPSHHLLSSSLPSSSPPLPAAGKEGRGKGGEREEEEEALRHPGRRRSLTLQKSAPAGPSVQPGIRLHPDQLPESGLKGVSRSSGESEPCTCPGLAAGIGPSKGGRGCPDNTDTTLGP